MKRGRARRSGRLQQPWPRRVKPFPTRATDANVLWQGIHDSGRLNSHVTKVLSRKQSGPDKAGTAGTEKTFVIALVCRQPYAYVPFCSFHSVCSHPLLAHYPSIPSARPPCRGIIHSVSLFPKQARNSRLLSLDALPPFVARRAA